MRPDLFISVREHEPTDLMCKKLRLVGLSIYLEKEKIE